jgi:hypothetical protein
VIFSDKWQENSSAICRPQRVVRVTFRGNPQIGSPADFSYFAKSNQYSQFTNAKYVHAISKILTLFSGNQMQSNRAGYFPASSAASQNYALDPTRTTKGQHASPAQATTSQHQMPAQLSTLSAIGQTPRIDSDASSRRRWTSSLSEGDRRLAAYVFARSVDQRRPDNTELKMLKEGAASIEEARGMLPWGRGNVASDLARTNNESFYRASAMRTTAHEVARLGLGPAQMASLSAYAGGGNCVEHSDVVMHIHAAKLRHGDRLHDVNNVEEDHEAVIQEGAGERPNILLDAWGNTSAINVQDSKYHSDPRTLETLNTYTQETGTLASQQFYVGLQNVNSGAHNTFDSELERIHQRNFKSVGARDSNIVDERFAQRVKDRIARTNPAINEAVAADAARVLGASDRAAVKAAPLIVSAAKNLAQGN